MNVVILADYIEEQTAAEQAMRAQEKMEREGRVRLEWVLADLLADIQAA